MRVAGLPLWALVLVLCALAPMLVRVFVDAELRRTKRKTVEVLRAAGPVHAASIQQVGDDMGHVGSATEDASRDTRS